LHSTQLTVSSFGPFGSTRAASSWRIWAEGLAAISGGIYLPFDICELTKGHGDPDDDVARERAGGSRHDLCVVFAPPARRARLTQRAAAAQVQAIGNKCVSS
jgi:hypothetical protein